MPTFDRVEVVAVGADDRRVRRVRAAHGRDRDSEEQRRLHAVQGMFHLQRRRRNAPGLARPSRAPVIAPAVVWRHAKRSSPVVVLTTSATSLSGRGAEDVAEHARARAPPRSGLTPSRRLRHRPPRRRSPSFLRRTRTRRFDSRAPTAASTDVRCSARSPGSSRIPTSKH